VSARPDAASTQGAGTTPASLTDQVTTLTDKAYRRLEEMIVTLQLPPGQVLSEAALTQSLGIGRTPVREALQRLSMEGMVVILPRRGVLVSEINVSNQLELLRVRREVERLMGVLAARRCSPAERTAMRRLAEAMGATAETNDDVEFMRLDLQFNAQLATSCRNEYARRTMGLMQGLSRRFWYQHYQQALDLPRCARLHAASAQAIADGDSEHAAVASDALIDYIEEFTRATLGRR
jgi:DNA-binding GntR family transcriptional regulator